MRDRSMFNAEMEALPPADQDRMERERLPRQLVRVIREAGIDAISSTPSYPSVLEAVVREELEPSARWC